jgi:SagB-type dehydrogenase family enzyme
VTRLLERRRTQRRFSAEPLPAARLGDWLGFLGRRDGDGVPTALYPSAGDLYPVQAYVYVKPDRVTGLRPGFGYYDPTAHALHYVGHGELRPEAFERFVNRPAFEAAAACAFLVAARRAIEPVYGDLWRDFSLLEAGAMLEVLAVAAPSLGLGVCPIGEVDARDLFEQLDLDDGHELLHTLLVGGLPGEQGREEVDEGIV